MKRRNDAMCCDFQQKFAVTFASDHEAEAQLLLVCSFCFGKFEPRSHKIVRKKKRVITMS